MIRISGTRQRPGVVVPAHVRSRVVAYTVTPPTPQPVPPSPQPPPTPTPSPEPFPPRPDPTPPSRDPQPPYPQPEPGPDVTPKPDPPSPEPTPPSTEPGPPTSPPSMVAPRRSGPAPSSPIQSQAPSQAAPAATSPSSPGNQIYSPRPGSAGMRRPSTGPGRGPGGNGRVQGPQGRGDGNNNYGGRGQQQQRPQNTGKGGVKGRGPQGRGQQSRGPGRGQSSPSDGFVLNNDIPFEEVRVLDKTKQMIGVMPLTEAMGMATAQSQDVILLSETAVPPLVRICSVSKYKYEIEKEKKEASKKQRLSQQELKELKLSPRTEVHDLQVRMRKAHKELTKGNKVKLIVQFRGREMDSMRPIALDLLEKVHDHCAEIAKFENSPAVQGRQMVAFLVPLK